MVRHLGRLKIVTKHKEGACNYKFCSDVFPANNGRVLPGEKVFILTRMGNIGSKTTIFYKNYHPECFVLWAKWTFEQTPTEPSGRKVMKLSPEEKAARARLVSTKARVLRQLRTVSSERLTRLVDRIAYLDEQIAKTGYPVIPYRGRSGGLQARYDKFLREVKEHYKHPLRVGGDMYAEAEKIGMLERFRKDVDTWLDECNAMVIERQGQDFETSQEDREIE